MTTDLTSPRLQRGRLAVLAIVLSLTSLIAIPGGLLYPEPATGSIYAFGDLAPIRGFWWVWNVLLSTNLVLNVPLLALAALILTPGRGGRWTSVGAVVMWLGTALYSVGIAGVAMAFYVATDPSLGGEAGTGVLARLSDDPRLYGVAIPGAILVALGTTVQAVGLLRARTVPRWVPVASLAILVTFFAPNAGPIGLITEVPITVSAIAMGWYAWRRTPVGRSGDRDQPAGPVDGDQLTGLDPRGRLGNPDHRGDAVLPGHHRAV